MDSQSGFAARRIPVLNTGGWRQIASLSCLHYYWNTTEAAPGRKPVAGMCVRIMSYEGVRLMVLLAFRSLSRMYSLCGGSLEHVIEGNRCQVRVG